MWSNITLDELSNMILQFETGEEGEIHNLWNLIKIKPEKWKIKTKRLGSDAEFWVTGIFGSSVIWYNDIEEGFNISKYDQIGLIKEYVCNQDDLKYPLNNLLNFIKSGGKK